MSPTRKRRRWLTAAVVLLTVTLAGSGFSYTMWSEDLTANGTVETGEVDVDWDFVICSEFHSWPNRPLSAGDFGEYLGKNVGSVDWHIDPDDSNIMYITVVNGYPSYAVDCQVEYTNVGTVPVHVEGATIVPVSGNLTHCVLTGTSPLTLSCDQLTVIYVGASFTQLHSGESLARSLRFHVEQPAIENSTYEFAVVECVGQWNENPTLEECIAAAP